MVEKAIPLKQGLKLFFSIFFRILSNSRKGNSIKTRIETIYLREGGDYD